jgi:predicted dehydrogenase
MKNFIEFIKGNEVPTCTLEDGIKIQKIISAIYQSQIEKRRIDLE